VCGGFIRCMSDIQAAHAEGADWNVDLRHTVDGGDAECD
jgi:hypothetical protein